MYPRHDFLRDGEWRCGCGAINSDDSQHCWQCDANTDGTPGLCEHELIDDISLSIHPTKRSRR